MRRLVEHVSFWVSFILFKVLINLTDTTPATPDIAVSGLWSQFLFILQAQLPYFAVYIPAVYAIFLLIDLYFNGRLKFLVALLLAVVVCAVTTPLLLVVNHTFILPMVYGRSDFEISFGIGSLLYYLFSFLAVAGIAGSVKLIRSQLKFKVLEQALLKEKADAELKFLKAQVSPHFLFNTLNNIYSLARKQSDKTAEAVLKLSNLLRFVLYEASQAHILLMDEIRLIESYIELEKLRYTNRLRIKFEYEVDDQSRKVSPLILTHFVENAFKHGAGESRFDIEIHIRIVLTQDVLTATFANSKGKAISNSNSDKIGLTNTRRQLEILYPGHDLTIHDNPDQFFVSLTIPLPK
ncbi:MAG: histidine kinase [Cyclobacteriaceae bacterium]|nr:histidine kinase [Cyclobacteriaceae bacterium]